MTSNPFGQTGNDSVGTKIERFAKTTRAGKGGVNHKWQTNAVGLFRNALDIKAVGDGLETPLQKKACVLPLPLTNCTSIPKVERTLLNTLQIPSARELQSCRDTNGHLTSNQTMRSKGFKTLTRACEFLHKVWKTMQHCRLCLPDWPDHRKWHWCQHWPLPTPTVDVHLPIGHVDFQDVIGWICVWQANVSEFLQSTGGAALDAGGSDVRSFFCFRFSSVSCNRVLIRFLCEPASWPVMVDAKVQRV
jgi:hypothetical protein